MKKVIIKLRNKLPNYVRLVYLGEIFQTDKATEAHRYIINSTEYNHAVKTIQDLKQKFEAIEVSDEIF